MREDSSAEYRPVLAGTGWYWGTFFKQQRAEHTTEAQHTGIHMSQEQLKVRASQHTAQAVEDLKEAYHYQYRTEAVEKALETGLSELGFLSDGVGLTPARRYVRELAKILAYVGATLLAISAFGQPGYLLPGIAVTITSLTTAAVDRWVLTRIEPAVTSRLPRIEVTSRGRAK